MTFPNASTRVCAVLGHPVAHSLSPPIHNAALRHAGLNGIYVAFDVGPEAFAGAVGGLRTLGMVGCNVTLPHKHAAFELADRRTREAERVGAANTLVVTADGLEAHNTDVYGVRHALSDLVRHEIGRALLLGAGGAGRAAAWALVEAGVQDLVIANRTHSRAEDLTAELRGAGHDVRTVPWDEAPDLTGNVDAILNATSVGLDGDSSPLPQDAVREAAMGGCRGVLDLVYGHDETPLVRLAHDAGVPAADGLGVLVHQAVEAYERFWGQPPDVEVMRQAALQAAERTHPHPSDGGRPPIV